MPINKNHVFIVVMFLLLISSNAVGFFDDFEDGDYTSGVTWSLWLQNDNCNTDTTLTVNNAAALNGSYGVDIYYNMDDDPRGDCVAHQDNNTCLYYTFSTGKSHYTFDALLEFPLTASEFCISSTALQRKLVYFKPVGWGGGSWAFFVVGWPWPDCATDGYNVSLAYGGPAGMDNTLWGDSLFDDTAHNHLFRNTIYNLRIEVTYGTTYGDDNIKIWLGEKGGTLYKILDRDLALRSSDDVVNNVYLGKVEMGRQIDLTRSGDPYTPVIYEHRYWDDVSIIDGPLIDTKTSCSGSFTIH